jgi:predicted nuclease of restriction endonuclease-like (RecB) superfamily
MKELRKNEDNLYNKILEILDKGRSRTLQTINENMLVTYWEIGKEIVESEQDGEVRARYGKELLTKLSIKLSNERGKGFSVDNLQRMRLFYNTFPIYAKASRKLSWSHYVELLKIKDTEQFDFYYKLLDSEYRSIPNLKRDIKSKLYFRQLAGTVIETTNSSPVLVVSNLNQVIISDPIVTEFLGFKKDEEFLENEFESRIIQNLEGFMLEIGRGFAFVARQKRLSMDGRTFIIDLVFYNTILKCFVLVDLKTGRLNHGDLGQMLMYVNFYDEEILTEGDNKTIGIVIAQEKDDMVVKYTLSNNQNQIYTARYQNYIPTESEIKSLIANIPDSENDKK